MLTRRFVRITKDGYDFVSAYDKQESVRTKFAALMEVGVPYLSAATQAIALLKAV